MSPRPAADVPHYADRPREAPRCRPACAFSTSTRHCWRSIPTMPGRVRHPPGVVDEVDFRAATTILRAYRQASSTFTPTSHSDQPLRERDAAALADAHARFMREVIAPRILPPALELVRMHQAQGDLSGSSRHQRLHSRSHRAAFGIEHLIALRLERGRGVPSPVASPRPELPRRQVARVGEWLQALHLDCGDFDSISVYSDSVNDLPLLERHTTGGHQPSRHSKRWLGRQMAHSEVVISRSSSIGCSARRPAPRRQDGSGQARRTRQGRARITPACSMPMPSSVILKTATSLHLAARARPANSAGAQGFRRGTNATRNRSSAVPARLHHRRRFRIVHVSSARTEHEVIEVSTFRATLSRPTPSRSVATRRPRAPNLPARVTSSIPKSRAADNVWGPQIEDARGAFHRHAMYYDPLARSS